MIHVIKFSKHRIYMSRARETGNAHTHTHIHSLKLKPQLRHGVANIYIRISFYSRRCCCCLCNYFRRVLLFFWSLSLSPGFFFISDERCTRFPCKWIMVKIAWVSKFLQWISFFWSGCRAATTTTASGAYFLTLWCCLNLKPAAKYKPHPKNVRFPLAVVYVCVFISLYCSQNVRRTNENFNVTHGSPLNACNYPENWNRSFVQLVIFGPPCSLPHFHLCLCYFFSYQSHVRFVKTFT